MADEQKTPAELIDDASVAASNKVLKDYYEVVDGKINWTIKDLRNTQRLKYALLGTAIFPFLGTVAGYFIGRMRPSDFLIQINRNAELVAAKAALDKATQLKLGHEDIAEYTRKLKVAEHIKEQGDRRAKHVGTKGGVAAFIVGIAFVSAVGGSSPFTLGIITAVGAGLGLAYDMRKTWQINSAANVIGNAAKERYLNEHGLGKTQEIEAGQGASQGKAQEKTQETQASSITNVVPVIQPQNIAPISPVIAPPTPVRAPDPIPVVAAVATNTNAVAQQPASVLAANTLKTLEVKQESKVEALKADQNKVPEAIAKQ